MIKRNLVIAIALMAMIMSLVACGSNESEKTEAPKTTEAPATEALTTEPPITEASTTEAPTTEEPTTEPETEAAKEYYSINENIPSDYFPFKVTAAGFADNYSYDPVNYLMPVEKGTKKSIYAGDGYKWLYYTVEYQYSGKTNRPSVTSLFSPKVLYLDYTFNSDFFVFVNNGEKWYILNDDNKAINHPLLFGLSKVNMIWGYEPLSDKKYEIRGIIKAPEKIVNDTENDIILSLYNLDKVSSSGIDLKSIKIKIR